ncbi:Gfo/Idh/MocA family oxidoreductase [Candidatus Poribacteria bacterium]|nr:Gfo/Idh/MocA family oxidoreductase [Candidatus Poribacteria bacterium]
MLRVGVIGMRGIGGLHARSYAEHPRAELVAVCDMVRERADDAAQKFGGKAYYTIQDMLESEEIDAVSVCTGGRENGGDHYGPVMETLNAGKHTLCEKPLSNDVALAREMVSVAREKGLYLGTNLNHRFVPFAWKAKEWMREGEGGKIGKPLFINMVLRIENPNESSPFFHFRALHPHSLDVMRFFVGDADAVHCFANRAPGRICWSNLSVNIHYKNGTIGHLSGSYDGGGLIERCEVGGTNGRFIIEGVYESLHYFARRGGAREVETNPAAGEPGHVSGFDDTFRNRIAHWVEQVDDRVPYADIEASGEAGLRVQEIIEAAIKSFQTRTVVQL